MFDKLILGLIYNVYLENFLTLDNTFPHWKVSNIPMSNKIDEIWEDYIVYFLYKSFLIIFD